MLLVNVTDCSETKVSIDLKYYLPDGKEEAETKSFDLSGLPWSIFIIPANLTPGSQFAKWPGKDFTIIPLFINGTCKKHYGKVEREVNFFNVSYHKTDLGRPFNCSLELFWDKQTGFLLEFRQNMIPLDFENSSPFKWEWKIADTNLFEMDNSLPFSWQPLAIGTVGLVATTALGIKAIKMTKRKEEW
jgi:hypothetical protein